MAPESWWKRAVFYRIDPARFQDSNGDGTGDLPGIVQRLDYLQSIGVDALLLDGHFDPDALGDLVREASQRHLRVILTLDATTAQEGKDALLNTVHGWLSAGVAGVLVPKPGESDADNAAYAVLTTSIRQMLRNFPGERILLSDPVPLGMMPGAAAAGARRGGSAPATGAQLVTAAALPVSTAGVAQLRASLAGATQGQNPEQNGLLRFAADPATGSPNAVADAALLLASRDAALFDFGDEIGLDTFPTAQNGKKADGESLPVMQWTPSNHTPAPVEQSDKPTPAQNETVYGAYHPYQPPPRGLAGPVPPTPHVAVDANIPPDPPAPDSLPGFTSGTLPVQPVEGARVNVITQDRDPKSILNAYRALIGLHHDNPALRNGLQYVLDRDAQGALVWLRRAPAGSRTSANVVVAANLTDKPVTLSLDADMAGVGMRGGALRPLLAYSQQALTGETTEELSLPPHAVFVGEVYRSGAGANEPAPRVHGGGRRHSRHRVRR